MKKIDLGQMIGILANVGVIAGIVFLGLELRQNTGVALATASQNMANAETQVALQWINDPGIVVLFSKPELTDEEIIRLFSFWVVWSRINESHWSQYQAGVIDEATLARYETSFTFGLSFPRNRNWWRNIRGAFDPRFSARIDESLDALELHQAPSQEIFRSFFADPADQ